MTFFVCCYLLLRLLNKEYFVFVQGEKEKLKKEKKHFEHEIEDDKSSLRQVDEAKKLNENTSPEKNEPYIDLKDFFKKQFTKDSTPVENLERLTDFLEEEIKVKRDAIEDIKKDIKDVTPTPSQPSTPEDPSTPRAFPTREPPSSPRPLSPFEPSTTSESPTTPERSYTLSAPSVSNDLKSSTSNKKENPSEFIDDLPSEFPSFMDEDD